MGVGLSLGNGRVCLDYVCRGLGLLLDNRMVCLDYVCRGMGLYWLVLLWVGYVWGRFVCVPSVYLLSVILFLPHSSF